ncbi:hypothetical protein [Actinomadura sp. 9N407]|uniref:hypothetical protein n=1 Tax=Actinomadura sp. 9N407 TaxID=3375154 RepID=UPI003791EDB9
MAYEFALTRTVRDAAHLLYAVQGPGVGDKYTVPSPRRPYAAEIGTDRGRLRVAVTAKAWSDTAVDGQVAAAAVQAGRELERMGHDVGEAAPLADWDARLRAWVAEGVAIGLHTAAGPVAARPGRDGGGLLAVPGGGRGVRRAGHASTESGGQGIRSSKEWVQGIRR